LGAGASFHIGAPLMNDFLDVSQHLYWPNALDQAATV